MATEALTAEENIKRLMFIGNCVDQNHSLPATRGIGLTVQMTVQEIANSTTTTLRSLGKQLKKTIENSDAEFDNVDEPVLGGVKVKDWVEFFKLTIRHKEHAAEVKAKKAKISALKSQYDDLKTPEEKRADMKKQLEALGEVI